jgi:hypothetical protein
MRARGAAPSRGRLGAGGRRDPAAAELGPDDARRTMVLYRQRQGDPDLYFYEMIQIADDGLSRGRTWHWIRKGRLETRTAIQETLVTRDRRAAE